jgi:hypothetical protein
MVFTFARFDLSRLVFPAACLACLLFLGGGRAQDTPSPAGKKAAQQGQKQAKEASAQEMNGREGTLLKEAYIYLSMANHDYNGHRHRAMGHLQEAAKILDEKMLKKGTDGQKTLALKQDIEAYRAKFLAKHSPTVHEPQALADLQMEAGLKLLTEVKPLLEQRKQTRVLNFVDKAIAEVNRGLAYRATGKG